jgi:hypothetical protein
MEFVADQFLAGSAPMQNRTMSHGVATRLPRFLDANRAAKTPKSTHQKY